MLEQYLRKNNGSKVTLSIDFTDHSQTHPINIEMWFSPTEVDSFAFLLGMRDFLTEQQSFLSFKPHYVLQSQRDTTNYLGCYSSGRYCPTEIEYKGKSEGSNIVSETLRQIIIWDLSPSLWWDYIDQFYHNCIRNVPEAFLNTTKI